MGELSWLEWLSIRRMSGRYRGSGLSVSGGWRLHCWNLNLAGLCEFWVTGVGLFGAFMKGNGLSNRACGRGMI